MRKGRSGPEGELSSAKLISIVPDSKLLKSLKKYYVWIACFETGGLQLNREQRRDKSQFENISESTFVLGLSAFWRI